MIIHIQAESVGLHPELTTQATEFATKQLPILKALQII